jgi:hypothetical protein
MDAEAELREGGGSEVHAAERVRTACKLDENQE